MALLAAYVASGSGGDQELWEQVERLLAAGIDHASEGDFHGAWTSFRDAFERGGASELVGLRRATYCRREGCPRMPHLARLLGKPGSALGFLSGACPDMTDHRCRRWAASLREGRAYLGEEAASPAVTQELELRLWFEENGDPRPYAVVEIGGEAAWAMIDTGGSRVYLAENWVGRPGADFRPIGNGFLVLDSDGEIRGRTNGVIHGFRLGALVLDRAAAQIVPDKAGVAFGMDILLRHDAVCFAWPVEPGDAGTLHLGTLGPCRGAEVAEQSFLSPRTGQPHLEVVMDDGTRLGALVDTGAISTHCKEAVLARHGDAGFRFGAHPALSAPRCLGDPYPIPSNYTFPIMVGMDTLLQFKAFGWELDPFRMYLLPSDG